MNPTPQPAKLATLVRTARDQKGLSQEAVGIAAGVGRSLVQTIERAGRPGAVTPKTRPYKIRNIARVLGIDERKALALAGHDPDQHIVGPPVGRPSRSEREFAELVNKLPADLRNAVVLIAESLPDDSVAAQNEAVA